MRYMNTDTARDAGTGDLRTLETILDRMGRTVIAFSGGVDSTFLAAVAFRACREKPVAITVSTRFQSKRETDFAALMARKIGIDHEILKLDVLGDKQIVRNSDKRCYFCKKQIFSAIKKQAGRFGEISFVHGINLDDLNDFRPGIQAAEELGFKAPFVEAGFSKSDIRRVSKEMGLETWNRPSQSCLATRIPHGELITPEVLEKVELAENYLNDLGLVSVRVRCHGALARIETEARFMTLVLENREKISRNIRQMGFEYVCMDIENCRPDSGYE